MKVYVVTESTTPECQYTNYVYLSFVLANAKFIELTDKYTEQVKNLADCDVNYFGDSSHINRHFYASAKEGYGATDVDLVEYEVNE